MGNPADNITPNTVLVILLLNELSELNDDTVTQSLTKFAIDRILVN